METAIEKTPAYNFGNLAPNYTYPEKFYNYYPFGLAMAENGYENVLETENKFKFQGQEHQDDFDLNWYDYGARMYDPSIGRWHVVDPLAEKYFSFSPYNYAINNPIKFIDIDGRDIIGTDGKPVTYQMVDNQAVWSKNADKATIRVGNALLRTRTGTSQLNKAISSDVKIKINVSDKSVKTDKGYKGGKTRYGNATRSRSTGKYKAGSAEIIIYEGSIEKLVSGDESTNEFAESGIDIEGGIGAVAGHEIEHATNAENIDQVHKNKLESQNYDVEAVPNEIHQQILKEEKERRNHEN